MSHFVLLIICTQLNPCSMLNEQHQNNIPALGNIVIYLYDPFIFFHQTLYIKMLGLLCMHKTEERKKKP